MQEKQFVNGLVFKPKSDKAPEWVLGGLSINVPAFLEWLETQPKSQWINVQFKMGKSGKPYAELDTWQPTETSKPKGGIESNFLEDAIQSESDMPF
jgi:hypothetical protein